MDVDGIRPFWNGFHDEKIFFSYHRCRPCGQMFAPVFLNGEQLSELYSNLPPNMETVPTDLVDATQRGYWEAATRGRTLGGDYLEIGADVGYLARHAAKSGKFDKFWLTEPNLSVHEQLARSAEGRPYEILTDMDDLSPVPDGSVGMAVMIHVLDHILDPRGMLEQIRAKLRPDGILAIVTHNEASLLRKVMGNRWPPFCLQHPELYNPVSIARLANAAGFTTVDVSRSKNYFPIPMLVSEVGRGVGLKLDKLPLPKISLGLKLGNMMTIAQP